MSESKNESIIRGFFAKFTIFFVKHSAKIIEFINKNKFPKFVKNIVNKNGVKALIASFFGFLFTLFIIVSLIICLVNRPGDFWGIYHGDYSKAPFSYAKLFAGSSSDEVDSQPQNNPFSTQTFKLREPIVIKIEAKLTSLELLARYSIVRDESNLEMHSAVLPFVVQNAQNPTIVRYVAVVLNTSGSDALGTGKYRFKIQDNNGKSLLQRTFKIEE